MIQKMTAVLVIAIAGSATGQAITGFSGGTQFTSWGGGAIGDTIGWRFTVNQDIIVTDLGIWNADTDATNPGLTADHPVAIWDLNTATMLTSGIAGPGGSAIGEWTYDDTPDIVLLAGTTYVIGAFYIFDDGDNYISTAAGLTTDPDVNFGGAHSPSVSDNGFAFPDDFSGAGSIGRFGPNFLFTPVPAPASAVLLGLGGIAAIRRRR